MKLVNKALNKIRFNLELKGLKNRCLLLKNEADLTESECKKSSLDILLIKLVVVLLAAPSNIARLLPFDG